jgi:hypothetical protein
VGIVVYRIHRNYIGRITTSGVVIQLMVWLYCVTWKLWFTGVAGIQSVLPACVAWIVQVPVASRVTVVPETPHILVVCELKLTVRPELAVALTVNGAEPNA